MLQKSLRVGVGTWGTPRAEGGAAAQAALSSGAFGGDHTTREGRAPCRCSDGYRAHTMQTDFCIFIATPVNSVSSLLMVQISSRCSK